VQIQAFGKDDDKFVFELPLKNISVETLRSLFRFNPEDVDALLSSVSGCSTS